MFLMVHFCFSDCDLLWGVCVQFNSGEGKRSKNTLIRGGVGTKFNSGEGKRIHTCILEVHFFFLIV
jgi:hypothetical protein